MQKTIISCKSRAVTKERMKAFLVSTEFVHDEFLIKIKTGRLENSCLENKIHAFSRSALNNFIYETRNKSLMEFKLKQDSLGKRAYEHGIRKEYVLENIHEFVRLAKIYMLMHRIKYKSYIPDTDNSSFIVLLHNEKRITTTSSFAGMELEAVITEEVLHELKYT